MRVAIIRREAKVSFSMDVYADSLIEALKIVRPNWNIVEFPSVTSCLQKKNSLTRGLDKYYQRYWYNPRKIARQKFDLVHVIDHSDGHFAYWCSNNNIPVVVTCHDLINLYQPENIEQQAKFPLISNKFWQYAVRGLNNANKIIAVSDNTVKDVVNLLNIESKKTTTIHNAVENIFKSLSQSEIKALRQKYNLSSQTFCLLHVGSNHPRKNVLSILKALTLLKKKSLNIHFLKAGGEFTELEKQYLIENELTNFVTYVGKPDKLTLMQIYNVADVLVSPSLFEGFGITILEAMACGTPVITSNSSSLPEVAGEAAILIDPLDVERIATSVNLLIKNTSLRQSLIDRGFDRAKMFSWEQTAEAVAQIYETLAH